MCFSASASFVAGSGLLVLGTVALTKVSKPTQIPFASIPLIFGIQQLTEGLIWLTMSNDSLLEWQQSSIYVFLAFAQVLWPFWVPFSIWLIEENVKRKKILTVLLVFGILDALFLAYCMVFYEVNTLVNEYHISYGLTFQKTFVHYSGVFYAIPTLLPFFISNIKKMYVLGLLNLGSLIFTKIFFSDYLISVWCFFGAVVSIYILVILNSLKKKID